MKQATERYYAQEGVRPELALTTLDGALLGLSDAIEHVLGPNEEVVGVVKQWLLPPLPERYEMACKSQQKGEYSVAFVVRSKVVVYMKGFVRYR